MKTSGTVNLQAVRVLRWVARLASGCLLLLWGAFFVEHLEWFTDPQQFPPPGVWLTQGLHLLVLLGLAIGWKWEWLGAVILLGSAPLLFWVTAGRNLIPFTLATLLPAALWLFCGWHDYREGRRGGVAYS